HDPGFNGCAGWTERGAGKDSGFSTAWKILLKQDRLFSMAWKIPRKCFHGVENPDFSAFQGD
ncbi:MAG: hypothetical protein PHR34_01950, partial [Kiritimatiellae bacterium]|nr:hypothetical protein [Kiritimatiellia bacterium]